MSLPIGKRLIVDKCKATVRYVGFVEGHQGTWVGLEWDDVSRGKHDGTVGSRRYFTCRDSAPRGSFVRETKLLQVAGLGTSIASAITKRYKDDAEDLSGSQADPAVEIVGLGAIKQQQALVQDATSFTLSNMAVSSIGPSGELRALAPNIRELDLAGNLLPSWTEAACLAQELPDLASLDLSLNPMAWPSDSPGAVAVTPFRRLKTLVLNQCCFSWPQVCALKPWLPALEELHLCGNHMSTFQGAALQQGAFSSLQTLVLDDNAISDWRALRPLYSLICLRCLSLSDNSIECIPSEELSRGTVFPQLHTLWLGSNQISEWHSVDALSALGALRELRLSGNPVVGGSEDEARFEVIARLGSLQTVNATPVPAYERKDSELRYMRSVLGQLRSLSGSAVQELRGKHPRLQELQQRYGDTGAAASAAAGGAVLSSSMIQLQLTQQPAGAQSSTLTKRFPSSMQLRKLRQLCERLFKLPTSPPILCVRDSSGALVRCCAAEDVTLRDLDLEDGSEIIVAEEGATLDEGSKAPAEGPHGRTDWLAHEEKIRQQLKQVDLLARAARSETSGFLAA